MNKTDIATALEQAAIILDLLNENPFKVRAYQNAARAILGVSNDLETLVLEHRLNSIKGIGKGLAPVISDLVTSGKSALLEELHSSVPAGVVDLLKIPGLGPKRIRILRDTLNIDGIPSLEQACLSNKLIELEGFGKTIQEKILNGIHTVISHQGKFLYPEALASAEQLVLYLKTMPEISTIEIAGSLRRKKEIIGDVDILISSDSHHADAIMNHFTAYPDAERIDSHGEKKSSLILQNGIQADVRVMEPTEFVAALHYFTGSKSHNIRIRNIAKTQYYKLNEYGLFKNGSDHARVLKSEEELYSKFKLDFIPPELREDMGEIEAAFDHSLPALVESADIKGTFHCHTNQSDGVNSLEEMATAARRIGWQYLGIADHSKSAAYANGLSEDRVRKQWAEIDRWNEDHHSLRIFKGTEADILGDGALDYPDSLLRSFDYVVGSVHSKFNLSESEMTKRIITAIRHPSLTMIGHLTGRLLLSRDSYALDVKAVIDAASDYGKMIELNSHPSRLDLDWRWCRYAAEKHVLIPINPDAHSIEGLKDVYYGVGIARKGWLTTANVVNTRSVKEIENIFEAIRGTK